MSIQISPRSTESPRLTDLLKSIPNSTTISRQTLAPAAPASRATPPATASFIFRPATKNEVAQLPLPSGSYPPAATQNKWPGFSSAQPDAFKFLRGEGGASKDRAYTPPANAGRIPGENTVTDISLPGNPNWRWPLVGRNNDGDFVRSLEGANGRALPFDSETGADQTAETLAMINNIPYTVFDTNRFLRGWSDTSKIYVIQPQNDATRNIQIPEQYDELTTHHPE
jgi:hypothetical protein